MCLLLCIYCITISPTRVAMVLAKNEKYQQLNDKGHTS